VRRVGVGVLVLLAVLVAVACRSRRATPPAAEPPLPAPPPGLLAELRVASPAALYAALRRSSKQEARLPADPALALGGLLDLPLPVVGALVLDRPAFGALVERDGAGSGIFACRVRSGPEVLRALAATAKPAPKAPAGDLVVLSGLGRSSLGVVDDWLLVSDDEPALRAAGLYVARTLTRRAVGPEPLVLEVGASALRGPLERALNVPWQRSRAQLVKLAAEMQTAQGRPPDFGDPSAILAKADTNVTALLATLAGADSLRLTFTPSDQELELVFELEPTPGSGVEASVFGLAPVPFEPILSLPAAAQLAVLTRLSARDLGLGEGAIGAAMDGLLGTSGSVTTLALLPGPGVVARYRVSNRVEAEKGIAELVRTVGASGAGAAFGPAFGKPRTSTVSVPGLGASAQRVQMPLVKAPTSKPAASAEVVDLLALVGPEDVFVAVAEGDARGLITSIVEPPAAGQLGKDPELRAFLSRHAGASTVMLANLGSMARAPRAATGLFTWGRRERRARASLTLTPGAVELVGGLLAR
jgi:hypothetical protein